MGPSDHKVKWLQGERLGECERGAGGNRASARGSEEAKIIWKNCILTTCLVVMIEHTEIANGQDQFVEEIGVLIVGTVPACTHTYIHRYIHTDVESQCSCK